MIQGKSVPAGEKRVSLFEATTAMIRKGKAGTPVEFGRVLWLAETEGGIAVGNVDGVDNREHIAHHHRQPAGEAPCCLGDDVATRIRPLPSCMARPRSSPHGEVEAREAYAPRTFASGPLPWS